MIKDGNLEFTKTDAKGLELIDPKELHGALQRDGIFLAYKYSAHPIALTLDVSKNLYLDVPPAVVSYAVLTSVIAEDEAETTEVIYWVRNNAQQFFSIQLPTKAGKAREAAQRRVCGRRAAAALEASGQKRGAHPPAGAAGERGGVSRCASSMKCRARGRASGSAGAGRRPCSRQARGYRSACRRSWTLLSARRITAT